jgi:hypothetical protein
MTHSLHRLAALLMAGFFSSMGGAQIPATQERPGIAASLVDGPYVLWQGRMAKVLSVRDGKALETTLPAPYDLDLPGLGSLRLDPAPPLPGPSSFPLPARIAAVSDIHGNLGGLIGLLRSHGVIDGHLDWCFRDGHLVVAGDVFDRGAQVTEVFWLLRHLEAQAPKAGGRVHVLLGNHEIFAFQGDERYLHPKYEQLQKKVLGMEQKALYSPSSDLGRWLRSRPVLLRLGPFLFAHAGPSPDMFQEEKDLEAFNAAFRRAIDQAGRPRLLGRSSPIWYRGLIPGKESKGPDASREEVEAICAAFQVRAVVVGHSTLKRGITAFHGGRVFGIDADLQSGAPGELWLYRNESCFRGLPDGSVLPLELAGPPR